MKKEIRRWNETKNKVLGMWRVRRELPILYKIKRKNRHLLRMLEVLDFRGKRVRSIEEKGEEVMQDKIVLIPNQNDYTEPLRSDNAERLTKEEIEKMIEEC